MTVEILLSSNRVTLSAGRTSVPTFTCGAEGKQPTFMQYARTQRRRWFAPATDPMIYIFPARSDQIHSWLTQTSLNMPKSWSFLRFMQLLIASIVLCTPVEPIRTLIQRQSNVSVVSGIASRDANGRHNIPFLKSHKSKSIQATFRCVAKFATSKRTIQTSGIFTCLRSTASSGRTKVGHSHTTVSQVRSTLSADVACTDVTPPGIHGRPFKTWGDVPGLDHKIGTSGYCPHGNILFLGWHRPYLALYEVSLGLHGLAYCANLVSGATV
jgi:hypothetical protein